MTNKKEILKIKQFINQVIPFKKEIILFGSRVLNNFTEDSDFDVLVIVEDKNIKKKLLIKSQTQIKRLCAKVGLDADIIVRDKKHTESIKSFQGNIINTALLTGVHI